MRGKANILQGLQMVICRNDRPLSSLSEVEKKKQIWKHRLNCFENWKLNRLFTEVKFVFGQVQILYFFYFMEDFL